MAPLKSLEQLVPLAIFLGMQLLEYVEIERRKRRLSLMEVWALRIKLAVPCAALAALLVVIILPTGYFGPLSSRVRGLFLKHTRTGNPLVDSVAEHQPGSTRMYHQYLHHVFYLVPVGFVLSLSTWTDSNSFLVLYGVVAYFFASKIGREQESPLLGNTTTTLAEASKSDKEKTQPELGCCCLVVCLFLNW